MYVLDENEKVYQIEDEEIICIEVSRPDIHYRTKRGIYKAPRTVADHRKIYELLGYMQIDKKKLVKLKLADKLENKYIHFGELKYIVSRDKLPKVKEIMDKNKSN